MAKLKSGKKFEPLVGIAKFPRISSEGKAEFLEIEFETLDYKTAKQIEYASKPDLTGVPFTSEPGERYGKPSINSPEYKKASELGFEFNCMVYIYGCCSRSIDFDFDRESAFKVAKTASSVKDKAGFQKEFVEAMSRELESLGLTYQEIFELTNKIGSLHKGSGETMIQLLENFLSQKEKSGE